MKIIGIDEVGRGCWAGPLVAAAVCLREPINGLTDSKLLTRAKRIKMAVEIRQKAHVGLGWVGAEQVDKIGLTRATSLAMSQALSAIDCSGGAIKIIIDGNVNFLQDCYLQPEVVLQTMIKADKVVPAVCAASIVAKVARDNFMIEQSEKYPLYQFEKHVGYGTSLHMQMLKLYGSCDLHRKTFKPIRALDGSTSVVAAGG